MPIPSKQRAIMDKHLNGGGGGDDDDGDDDDLEVVSPPEKSTVTPIEDDEDDAPEVVDTQGEVLAPRRASRDEKKQNRFREANERANEAQAQVQRQNEFNERLLRQIEARDKPPAEKTKNPLETELESTQRDLDLLAAKIDQAGGKITREQEAEFMKQARDLRGKETRLYARMALQEENAARGNQNNVTPEVIRRQAAIGQLQAEFHDVFTYSRRSTSGREVFPAVAWAKSEWEKRMAKANLDVVADEDHPLAGRLRREALREAQREFSLGPARDISEGQRRKFGGVASGGGGGGGSKRVVMTPMDQKMMDARFKHIKDKGARIKAWTKQIGAKRVAAK